MCGVRFFCALLTRCGVAGHFTSSGTGWRAYGGGGHAGIMHQPATQGQRAHLSKNFIKWLKNIG